MMTPYYRSLLWDLVHSSVNGGFVEVSDGGKQSARVSITKIDRTADLTTVSAVFKADQGNFDWKVRRVLDKNGKVIDEVPEDAGRKVAGAIWNVVIELGWGSL